MVKELLGKVHLRVFGSNAWVHIPKAVRRKGQPKLRFTGYEPSSKNYRFSNGSKRIVRATQPMRSGPSSSSFSLAATSPENTRNTWLLDSGASQHIANNPQTFSGLRPTKQTFVSLANGQRCAVKGE
ncbi:hypothetical protein E2320_000091, partial [Naja naja]